MPKVQQYGERKVQETAQATPYQNLNSGAAFGAVAGIGEAVQGLGDTIDKIATENDMATAKERTNILRDKIRDAMYHDPDAYYRTGGRDAMTGRDGARDRIAEIRREVGDGLSGRQLKMYDQIAEQYQQREYDGIENHSFKGRKSWLDQNDQTAIEAAQQDLVVHHNDPGPYIKQIENATLNLANRNGWDKDTRELETLKATTVAHKSAIDTLLKSSPAVAKKYFDDAVAAEQILPSMRDDLSKLIHDQGNAQAAMAASDAIRTAGGDRASRLAAVNEIKDPAIRKAAKTQVIADLQQEKLIRQEGEMTAYQDALKAINGGPGQKPVSALQYQLSNPDGWNAMTGTQQSSLLKGNAVTTDQMAYWEFTGLMSEDKDSATDYFLQNMTKFSSADAKQIMDKLRKPAPVVNVLSNQQAFNEVIEEVFGKEPKGKNMRAEWTTRTNIMRGYYQEKMSEWSAENGDAAKVPDKARQEILKDMRIKMNKPGHALFGLMDAEVGFRDIPADKAASIRNRLIEQGVANPSPEQILSLHIKLETQ